MKKTLTAFAVVTTLPASAFAASAQEQATPERGEMMQIEGSMQGGMMDGDMMGKMKIMAECTEMMASMTENMDGGKMPSEKSDG
jgi:predicted lipoprotein with Yx(FWY)xxD motif